MQPVYTSENTHAAYQLNWSLSLFGKDELPAPSTWREILRSRTEADGVRILTVDAPRPSVVQFFVSTRPDLSPSDVVRSVKGRLQYLVRDQLAKAFRRNHHIQSLGEATSRVLDQYVAGQPAKHPMADRLVQARIEAYQFHDEAVDLAKPSAGTYGQFLNALQIVLENSEGWCEVREPQLKRVRDVIVGAARKKAWSLSRVGLLSNHLHILLGVSVTESPQMVALSIMNNIAYVYEMKPILKFSYYAGTIGGYDRGAIRRRVE